MIKELFKRKVPLGAFLVALAMVFLCAVQLLADINMHNEDREIFIEDLKTYSEGIYLNLENVCQQSSDSEKMEASLIGAYLYSMDLQGLIYRVPRHTIFGKKCSLFFDVDVSPNVAFPFVSSQLKQIRDEYFETGEVSADSISTIEMLSTAFSEFCAGVGDEADISQRTFTEWMNKLTEKIYPFRGA